VGLGPRREHFEPDRLLIEILCPHRAGLQRTAGEQRALLILRHVRSDAEMLEEARERPLTVSIAITSSSAISRFDAGAR
jgi:hypothetical protein